MTSSFSFAALAKTSAAWLHHNGILEKEIKLKLSLIIAISFKIQATSREHILSEISNSITSAKLHSTCTWEKLILWQKSRAFLNTQAVVHSGCSSFTLLSQAAANTSPQLLWMMRPRLHGHAIFGVVLVSDTGTGTTRRIPVSGECPLFFFFRFSDTRRRGADTAPTQLRRGSDASDTPAVKKKKKISAYFGSFRTFRQISAEMKISSDTRFWLKKKKNQNQDPTSSFWVSCFSSSSSSS